MTVAWERLTTAELAAIVCDQLDRCGIRATLVGGACVTIYSDNRYISGDLDFVTDASLKELEKPLRALGFVPTGGRHFEHPRCAAFIIDFPAPPLSIGGDPVREINRLRMPRGTIRLLTPTDCVRDRLAAYYHWNDPQGLEQALMVASSHSIDHALVKRWSKDEKATVKHREFMRMLRRRKGGG
ncbi:MAG: hypothetical protein NT045_09390 [Candidatus Aureabacteria bacterium]|nr:hypothetical protein [Candidatus Auribacterota bacterium]